VGQGLVHTDGITENSARGVCKAIKSLPHPADAHLGWNILSSVHALAELSWYFIFK
jgi:hypothetical protein